MDTLVKKEEKVEANGFQLKIGMLGSTLKKLKTNFLFGHVLWIVQENKRKKQISLSCLENMVWGPVRKVKTKTSPLK